MTVEVMKHILDQLFTSSTISVDPSLFKIASPFVSNDALNGISKFTYLNEFTETNKGRKLLDFGCGRAAHRGAIVKLGLEWHGIDLFDSSDFRGESTSVKDVIYYDGGRMPFGEEAFDVIFSSQSFEHVLNPYDSMAEVARCLKRGGSFIGSVSFLEPYHAFSTFGYSPHGFITVAQKAGLAPKRLHPETDGLGLIFRKLLVITKQPIADKAISSFNIESLLGDKAKTMSIAMINCLKLQFCGHFCFWFTRTV
jgi:SAM-dependent methyltransferase